MAEERTEQPTSRRLKDARRKGQIARSKDVSEAVQLAAVLIALGWWGEAFVGRLGAALARSLERLAGGPDVALDPGVLVQVVVGSVATLGLLVAPVALASAAATVGAATLQGGWNVATEALRLDFSRLNPANGLKRLAGRLGIDTVKMLLYVTVIAWLSAGAIADLIEEAPRLGRLAPALAAAAGWRHAERLVRLVAIAMALLAGADYLVQRWRHLRSLRMTKQEVKDDTRLTEGNPEVKARQRRLQREVVRRRMLAAVPKATVVVTNPTHYAVALEYRRDTMPAPRVVAKGRGVLAARIRAIAREHGVPIVENVPLAQALYKGVEVGAFIPSELFGAVAEVLAYLIRLRQLVLE
jgi:flagellar biosynthetic protein FlhB